MTDRPILSLQRVRHAAEIVMHVRGEIDGATAAGLEHEVNLAIDERPERLLIDASGVTFCDSRGLAALFGCWQRAQNAGCELTLRNPSARLQRVLEITGIGTLIGLDRD